MQSSVTIQSKSLIGVSNQFYISISVARSTIYPHGATLATKSSNFHHFLSVSSQTQIRNVVICARKKPNRSGSQRSTRFIINFLYLCASNLKLLPQPLDVFISELSNGYGGGLGFGRGLGGGFDKWRRKGKKILMVWAFLGLCGLCLWYRIQIKIDAFHMVLGLVVIGLVCIQKFKIGVNDWVFGCCCLFFCAMLSMGLGLKTQNVMRWVDKISVSSPLMETVRRYRIKETGKRRRRV